MAMEGTPLPLHGVGDGPDDARGEAAPIREGVVGLGVESGVEK